MHHSAHATTNLQLIVASHYFTQPKVRGHLNDSGITGQHVVATRELMSRRGGKEIIASCKYMGRISKDRGWQDGMHTHS